MCSYLILCSCSHLCNTLQHAFINITAFGPPDIQRRSEGLRPFPKVSQLISDRAKMQAWCLAPVISSHILLPFITVLNKRILKQSSSN